MVSESREYSAGSTYWSIETLFPIPPNSPWIPILLGSYGLDWME